MTDPPPPADPWRAPAPTPAYGGPAAATPGAPPPYGAPYGAPAAQGVANGLGTAALVLGIIGVVLALFVVGGLLGIVAVIFGFVGRGRVKRGRASNRGAATTGIVLGALSVVIAATVVTVVVTVFGPDFRDYIRCMDRANGSAIAEQACRDRLERQIDRHTGR